MQVPSLDPDATLAQETQRALVQLVAFVRRHKYWPSISELEAAVAVKGLDRAAIAPLIANAVREGLAVLFLGHARVTARGWKVLKIDPIVALLPDYPKTRENYRIYKNLLGGT